jgi:hypothetical protein
MVREDLAAELLDHDRDAGAFFEVTGSCGGEAALLFSDSR